MATEKATKGCPKVLDSLKEGNRTDVDYADMEPEQQLEYWKKIEKEEEERFRCKYSDVLAAVPVSAGEKMQYFAKVMLQLLPDTFHGSWDARFDTWMDFYQFYIIGFDPAYGTYIQENKELEKPYLYKFGAMAGEKLEKEFEDCLEKIIALYSEKQKNKAEMLYHAVRLFEFRRNFVDFILQRTNERIERRSERQQDTVLLTFIDKI